MDDKLRAVAADKLMAVAARNLAQREPAVPAAPNSLSDSQLLRRLGEIMRQSRRIEADLVAHIAEVDVRRLYAREGCSAMFVYCTLCCAPHNTHYVAAAVM